MLKSFGSQYSMSRTCGPQDVISLVIPRLGDNRLKGSVGATHFLRGMFLLAFGVTLKVFTSCLGAIHEMSSVWCDAYPLLYLRGHTHWR
jgi:hypothetical protein